MTPKRGTKPSAQEMSLQPEKARRSTSRESLMKLVPWAMGLVAVCALGVSLGAVFVPLDAVLDALWSATRGISGGMQQTLIVGVRLPRVVLAVFVGGALAVAGAIYQALFRNALADPYILGVSSGAGLGAMLALVLSAGFSVWRWGLVPLCAFAGAMATMTVVTRLGSRNGRFNTMSLLLAGVAISYTLAALTSFVMVMAREQMSAIVYWNMGGLNLASWEYVAMAGPLVIITSAIAWYFARDLDLMLLGDERAGHLGLDAQRFTKQALTVATVLTAAAVSVSGLVGFVGLMVPHIVRLRYGPSHRLLLPLSFLGGAILLVLADVIARTILAPIEIPVGIVTAVIGGPFFVWMLMRERGTF